MTGIVAAVVRLKHSVAILLFLLLHSENELACSFAHGYFYQVTAMRGRIVSYTWRLRRLWGTVGVTDARLMLYEYRFPAKLKI
jgi:hypothetical protein